MKEKHRQAIEEKDATIALLNGDLKNCEYENVGLHWRKISRQLPCKDVTQAIFKMKTKTME